MILASLLSITTGLNAAEPSQETQWNRLIEAQLELASEGANGLGEQHPTTVKLKAELEALQNQIPDRRNQTYIRMLQSVSARINREDVVLQSKGLGPKHPSRQSIVAQNALIHDQLEEFGKSFLIRIGGAVKKPGFSDWAEDSTLQSAVEKAGGISESGNLERVTVWRDGAKTIYDLSNAGQGATKLLPGDIVDVDFRK